MKKVFFLSITLTLTLIASSQEFAKQVNTARSAYASGKLDDSRFAMQQMLQEIDMVIGKEVLKILPSKMEEQAASTSKDQVTGTSGFIGTAIHREYGTADKMISLDIITNSPLIGTFNAILSVPLIANTGDQKVIKIDGYKAVVQKVSGGTEGASDYEVQLPLHNNLITLKAPGYSQEQVIKMANTLPTSQIAKMLQ
ncbi:MAG TPA: hypothetical protein VD794_15270 [Flavisolibacter sp.]|nr:hypothetical protein [Flavisolibacter sp.]